MSKEIERVEELDDDKKANKADVGLVIDYAAEYRKQTGKDYVTGEYVSQ